MSKLGLHPTGTRLVVEPEEKERVSDGGIFIPESASVESAVTGRVLTAGPDTSLPEGQRILYGRMSGTKLTLDGRDVLLLKEEQVLGRLDEGVKVEQDGSLA